MCQPTNNYLFRISLMLNPTVALCKKNAVENSNNLRSQNVALETCKRNVRAMTLHRLRLNSGTLRAHSDDVFFMQLHYPVHTTIGN